MRKEVLDPNSGAILFKKDDDSKEVDLRLEELTKRVSELEKRLGKLEKTKKENS